MIRTTVLATASAVLAVAAASAPATAVAPIPNGVTCTMKVQRSYDLDKVAKKGLPVDIACTGEAHVGSSLDFDGKAEEPFVTQRTAGLEGSSGHRGEGDHLPAAGTITVHVKLAKYAVRRARELRKSKLRFIMLVKREDGRYTSVPAQNKKSVLINRM